jgi:thiosulfate dehydrogenase
MRRAGEAPEGDAMGEDLLPALGDRKGGGRGRARTAGILLVGALLGIGFLFSANKGIQVAGTNEFCAQACHTMKPAADAYRRSVHFANAVGVPATCSDCHIVNESERNKGAWQWAQLVVFKAKVGLTDVVDEMRGTISTPEKWEAERARLGKQVRAFVEKTDSRTCRGCHELQAFRSGSMYQLVHGKMIEAKDVDCVSCHPGVGHVYDRPPANAPPPERQPAVASIAAVQGRPGPVGDLVRLGKQLFQDTATNPESRPYVGKDDKATCNSCHRKEGTDLDALPLFGAAAAYPADVDGKVMTLEGRIAQCFATHLDGSAPPPGSPALLALSTYVTSLSEGRRMAMSVTGGGPRALAPIARDAPFWSRTDAAAGKVLYGQKCAACHGADGSGGGGPAVWGPGAWNAGAALARAPKLAAYLQKAMAAYAGSLSDEQARDLAAFVDSQPRPGFPPPGR